MNYCIRGKEVYSERGKLVATLDAEGNPTMAPGMAGPHSAGVREFLKHGNPEPARPEPEKNPAENPAETEPEPERPTVFIGTIRARKPEAGGAVEPEERTESEDEWLIDSIPRRELPDFTAQFGVYTPGFQTFVRKHKLSGAQVALLIRRIRREKE